MYLNKIFDSTTLWIYSYFSPTLRIIAYKKGNTYVLLKIKLHLPNYIIIENTCSSNFGFANYAVLK